MIRWIRTGLLFSLSLLAAWRVEAAAPRAVWMWEANSYIMVESRTFADEAVTFLRSKKIQTIFLYADEYRGRNLIVSEPDAYRRLIKRLHDEGFSVYALLGSWYLHTEQYMLPAKRGAAVAMFQRVLTYNARAHPEERFDGINFDIEPHMLDDWSAHREELLRQYLDMGKTFMELKRSSKQQLAVGPAVPFWLDGIDLAWNGQTRKVSEHVIDTFDYSALMDYRDHAEGKDGIISHASDEMEYANRVHKRLLIGLELTSSEITKLSFDHLKERDLEREIALTEAAYEKAPAFGGFVFHHFSAYRDWLERQKRESR